MSSRNRPNSKCSLSIVGLPNWTASLQAKKITRRALSVYRSIILTCVFPLSLSRLDLVVVMGHLAKYRFGARGRAQKKRASDLAGHLAALLSGKEVIDPVGKLLAQCIVNDCANHVLGTANLLGPLIVRCLKTVRGFSCGRLPRGRPRLNDAVHRTIPAP